MTLDKQAQRGMQLAADHGWTLLQYAESYAPQTPLRIRREAARAHNAGAWEPEIALDFRARQGAERGRFPGAEEGAAPLPPPRGAQSAAARRLRRDAVRAGICAASAACLLYAAFRLEGAARPAMAACGCALLLEAHGALRAALRVLRVESAVRGKKGGRGYAQ